METKVNDQEFQLGKIFFRLRDYTPIPLIILLLATADPSLFSAITGAIIALAGELLRILCIAKIGSISRTRKDQKESELIKTGAFAIVRNPIYIANGLIVLGFSIFSGNTWFVLVALFFWALQYHLIVKYEEKMLEETFKQEYTDYQKKVHRWFPQNISLKNLGFSSKTIAALQSEKRTFTALIVVFSLLLISY
jgi:protein-S-isoprenylcysteine O-methyltransferase Ste14